MLASFHLIFFLFLNLFLFLKFKTFFSPMLSYVIIWMGVVLYLIINASAFFEVQSFTLFLIYLSLSSFVAGTLLSSPRLPIRDIHYKLQNRRFSIFLILSLPVMLYSLFYFFEIVSSYGVQEYVLRTRWEGNKNAVFGGALGFTIATVIVKGLIYALFFYSIALYCVSGRKCQLASASVLFLTFSIVLMSRFEFVIYGLTIVAGLLLSQPTFSVGKVFKIFGLIICFIFLLTIFTGLRSGWTLGIYDIFVHYLLNYHSYGVLILDESLSNLEFGSGDFRYGIGNYTFPVPSYIVEQIIGALSSDEFRSSTTELKSHMSDSLNVTTVSGEVVEVNAFYTTIFLAFMDFGAVGVIFYSIIFGYFFASFYQRWKRYRDVGSLSLLLFFVYTSYSSIFYPPQITIAYWVCFFALLLISFRINIGILK